MLIQDGLWVSVVCLSGTWLLTLVPLLKLYVLPECPSYTPAQGSCEPVLRTCLTCPLSLWLAWASWGPLGTTDGMPLASLYLLSTPRPQAVLFLFSLTRCHHIAVTPDLLTSIHQALGLQ